jgi:hypothetical protein
VVGAVLGYLELKEQVCAVHEGVQPCLISIFGILWCVYVRCVWLPRKQK